MKSLQHWTCNTGLRRRKFRNRKFFFLYKIIYSVTFCLTWYEADLVVEQRWLENLRLGEWGRVVKVSEQFPCRCLPACPTQAFSVLHKLHNDKATSSGVKCACSLYPDCHSDVTVNIRSDWSESLTSYATGCHITTHAQSHVVSYGAGEARCFCVLHRMSSKTQVCATVFPHQWQEDVTIKTITHCKRCRIWLMQTWPIQPLPHQHGWQHFEPEVTKQFPAAHHSSP